MKNIIILLPGPFLKRDYERFGIEKLEKNFSVKVLDFTAWTHPTFWKRCSKDVFNCKELVIITCKKDFLIFLDGKSSNIIFDLLPSDSKTAWVRNTIKKNKKNLFVELNINLAPRPNKNIKRILSLILNPIKFINKIFKFLLQKHYESKKIYPDISIISGLSSLKKSKSNKKIFAHCMDYDIYLGIKNKPNHTKEPYAVFLDQNIVYHSDHIFDKAEQVINETQYYPLLVEFFKELKIKTKLKILFAVNPKTSKNIIQKLPNLLKGIEYQIGNTAQLVKDSSLVLSHTSTAISFAILFNKPIIFLTTNELKNSRFGPEINNFAKVTNSTLINISNNFNKKLNLQDLLKVDEDKYKNYLQEYIKMHDSPELPLWEIFATQVKNHEI